MKLRFTPQATSDIIQIAEYIRTENPHAALRVRAAILDSLQTLIEFPRMGRPQTVDGVRKFVTHHYPYLVYYAVNDPSDEVVVLSIRHPARARAHSDS